MKPKIVLVGAGRFGRNHLRVLKELEKDGLCTLHGVVDKSSQILEDVKKNYGITTTSDLADILESNIDAVDIVTPADTHFQICRQCLAAGKHVLVEKPLTTDYTKAKELVELAAKKDRLLMVGHIFRYNPAVKKIKELINEGTLGRIYYMFAHYGGFKDPRAEVGALLNFAVHPIDIYDYLIEEKPREVTSSVAYFLGRDKFEDMSLLVLEYRDGVFGIIECSWLPPGNYRDLTIVGSEKSVMCDLLKQTVTIRDIHMERSRGVLKAVDKGTENIGVKVEEPLKLELRDFMKSIRTGRKPLANGQIGARVVMIAEKALVSARLKRSVKIDETE